MKQGWRKILYEEQGVPDNHVDQSFLEEMKKNLYTRTYDFWNVVRESGTVTQQMSCVCLFIVGFVYMNEGRILPETVFIVSSLLTFCAYCLNRTFTKYLPVQDIRGSKRTLWDDIKTTVIFLGFGYGLSPLLMTLTHTVSTDTIYAMTVFMLLANLLFHDYGADAAMVSQSLSLNAAIFASVCLASRLPTTWHTFTTVTYALEIFALFPEFRRNLKTAYPRSQVAMTTVLGALATVSLGTVSTVGTVMFVLCHLFVTFVCPAMLIKMQPFKNNIYGPWDEAVVKD